MRTLATLLLLIAPCLAGPWDNLDVTGPVTATALLDSGKVYPGAHASESEVHPLLQRLATEHAAYQARVCVQGHQAFQYRYDEIAKELKLSATEICAESWDRQKDDSLADLGHEMFRCWNLSAGHWNVASAKHQYVGADMAQGRNGIWYACVIVADARSAGDPWAAVAVEPEKPAAEKWVRVGEPTAVIVACPTCPSGFRSVGQTAQRYRSEVFGTLMDEISDDTGILGWRLYGYAGQAAEWKRNFAHGIKDPIDKAFVEKWQWVLGIGTCGMVCSSHGGWHQEKVKVPAVGSMSEASRVPDK